jgi:glycerate kinase
MKVICAPDSFKESISAAAAAAALARGVRRALPQVEVEIDPCPIADGGEGTVEALCAAMHGRLMHTTVRGPLGAPVNAAWALIEADTQRLAIIEMAAAAGLALVPPEQRDPTVTTTFGLGQLIVAALDHGCARFILGIGGSATTDGGAGMAQALGVTFRDAAGHALTQPLAGGQLQRVARLDRATLDPRLRDGRVRLEVACDVTNPLTGPRGAAAVYGPQKGATPAQVLELDAALTHLSTLWRRDLHCDVMRWNDTGEPLPGGGAAGGLGGGLVAFLGATLCPGIELVLHAVNFDQRVRGCDLCLTGEGKLDGQSLQGKACLGVARAAAQHGVPTVALVGCLGDEVQRTTGPGLLADYRVISPAGTSVAESMRRADEFLEAAAARVARERLQPIPSDSELS